jgi:hypothetical protein
MRLPWANVPIVPGISKLFVKIKGVLPEEDRAGSLCLAGFPLISIFRSSLRSPEAPRRHKKDDATDNVKTISL